MLLAITNCSKYDQNVTIDTIFEVMKTIKNFEIEENIFISIIDHLEKKNSVQLWFNTILKLAKKYMYSGNNNKLQKILDLLE